MIKNIREILKFSSLITKELPPIGRWWTVGIFLGSVLAIFGEFFIAYGLQLLLSYLGAVEAFESNYFSYAKQLFSERWLLFIIFGIGSIVRFVSGYLVQYGAIAIREMGQEILRGRAFEVLLFSNPFTQKKIKNEVILSLYAEVFPRASGALLNVVSSVSSTIQVASLGVGLFYISKVTAALGITVTLVIGVLIIRLNKDVRRFSSQSPKISEGIFKHLERISRNILFIKVSRLEQGEEKSLKGDAYNLRNSVQNAYRYATLSSLVPALLGTFSIVAIVIFSREFLFTPAKDLILFLYLYTRFSQGLGAVATQLGYLNGSIPHINSCLDFYKTIPTITRIPNEGTSASNHDQIAPTIQISNVSFDWSGRSNESLVKDLSIKLKSGDTLIIEGPSGSGKSTLLLLILGIITPNRGQILIGDKSASDFFAYCHHQAAYAGPNPFMINGSIRENLLYGATARVNDDIILEVLDRLGLLPVINSKPDGLDAEFNLLSPDLSTGQQQRLSLARALIRKPTLLILDEITANLDIETEIEIVKAISQIQWPATKIIVTHRQAMSKIGHQKIKLEENV